MIKAQITEGPTYIDMPKLLATITSVDVHLPAAHRTTPIILRDIQCAMETINLPAGSRSICSCLRVIEAVKKVRYTQMSRTNI